MLGLTFFYFLEWGGLCQNQLFSNKAHSHPRIPAGTCCASASLRHLRSCPENTGESLSHLQSDRVVILFSSPCEFIHLKTLLGLFSRLPCLPAVCCVHPAHSESSSNLPGMLIVSCLSFRFELKKLCVSVESQFCLFLGGAVPCVLHIEPAQTLLNWS